MRPPEHLPDPVPEAPKPSRAPGKRKLIAVLLGVAALGVAGAIAWPMLGADGGANPPDADSAQGTGGEGPAPNPATTTGAIAGAVADVVPKKPAADVLAEVSQDGDLELQVSLRFNEVPTGSSIPAEVRFVNHTPRMIHLPAAGEPHPTLALVLVDRDGREVRRVVETNAEASGDGAPSALPRRTVKLLSGRTVTLPQHLVTATDEPLPPGRYTLHAEFRADPLWPRVGLPMWTAPKGSLRSDLVVLTVTEK